MNERDRIKELTEVLRREAVQLVKVRCFIEDAELDELIRASAMRMIGAAQENTRFVDNQQGEVGEIHDKSKGSDVHL